MKLHIKFSTAYMTLMQDIKIRRFGDRNKTISIKEKSSHIAQLYVNRKSPYPF